MTLTTGPGSPPRATYGRRHLRPVFSVIAGLGMLCLSGPARASDTAPRVPAWRHLDPDLARRFVEQGIDEPGPQLLRQAEDRAAGSVTQLNVVVVLVDFPDFPADRVQHPREYFEQLFFGRGETSGRSVAQFLSESSRGRLELGGEVRGWFTVSNPSSYYLDQTGGIGYYPHNSQRLAEEAFHLADPTINYAHFDNDGPDGVPDSGDDDGLVDGFLVIHAGSGTESSGGGGNFVSLFWYMPTAHADGVFCRPFTLTAENGNIGVVIHELGHLLGLPDLYDTDGDSFGLGAWSMMAGGLNLDMGRQPADFDAWSKVRLGFADVVNVSQNATGVPIAPTVNSGIVFRLWREGILGKEYFLVENRRQTGLDAALPGQGLLIYHVDESVTSNRNANHYMVALEQADGRYQLEDRFNDFSIGDDGDPYRAGDAFGHYTDPSSSAYDGTDSFVHVFDITEADSAGVVAADLSVNAGPLVEVADLNPKELNGNGDGLLSPGELIGLTPAIAVSRVTATGLTVTLRSLDPLGTLLDEQAVVGTVPAGQVLVLPDPLRIQVSPDIPSDPYGLDLEMELQWDSAPPRVIPVELGIGSLVGRSDTFENPDHGWTHARVRPSANDLWTYGAAFGKNGSAGFRYGYLRGGFPRNSDAVLVSPPILLPPNAQLLFDHHVDVRNPDSTRVQAGGVVEVSINGSDWQTAFPEEGYPRVFYGNQIDWIGRPVFSGRATDPDFHTERIDLSGLTGELRVRFRFFSEVDVFTGAVWAIDNVRVTDDATPVRVLSAQAVVEGNDIRLSWRLAAPLPERIRWRRGPRVTEAEAVSGWMAAAESGSFVDRGGAASLPGTYWLEALDRTGERDTWGPVSATGGAPARPWVLLANPSRAQTHFSWNTALPADARIEIFDVRGRLILSDPAGSTGTYAWDGRDASGRRAAPGIYFARMRGDGVDSRTFPPLRIVRLP